MTSHLLVKNCDGGHICHPPKECCKQGCCYPMDVNVYRPPTISNNNMFIPLFAGHWYFWAAITATLAGILCACSLWRRHSSSSNNDSGGRSGGASSFFCCTDSGGGREDGLSEPESNGSCYAPPQYSRCSSFHQAPPPYTEVTSKPDLYPLVISYNRDTVVKANGPSTGYLMVQYFRNFIVRPVGSLSATSTIDSLSSSFICNAANEANTIIPPTYSCMGSLEEVRSPPQHNSSLTGDSITGQTQHHHQHLPFPNSSSSATCNELPTGSGTAATSPSVHSLSSATAKLKLSPNGNAITSQQPTAPSEPSVTTATTTTTTTTKTSINNSIVEDAMSSLRHHATRNYAGATSDHPPSSSSLTNTLNRTTRKLNFARLAPNHRSCDSDEDHNFSDLLNLSVCVPSSGAGGSNAGSSGVLVQATTSSATQSSASSHVAAGDLHNLMQHGGPGYSVTNSMTSSDISSLANLGTPDSPPRATSPTLEMKELLDKIQQLPQQQKSPVVPQSVEAMGNAAGLAEDQSSQSSISNWATTAAHHSHPAKVRAYFHRSRAKTLYMPLYEGPTPCTDGASTNHNRLSPGQPSPNGSTAGTKTTGVLCHVFGRPSTIITNPSAATKTGWLSRSAPTTPCGAFTPNFPLMMGSGGGGGCNTREGSSKRGQKNGSQKGSKCHLGDGSPLLNENDESDEEEEVRNMNIIEPRSDGGDECL